MSKLFRWIYFLWIAFWFLLGFLCLYPLFFIIIQKTKWHRHYYWVSKLWAKMFYCMTFLPVKKTWHFQPSKNQKYIYCPNHFSYMDIPILTLTLPSFSVFVGLHDLERIPLFGYMYRKIHITVNRGSLKNRYQTYQRTKEALQNGKNVVIFPEGGIWTEDFPMLSPFKEGPFRVAIEQQIPIVPVTIPYNWMHLPSLDISRLRWYRQEVIFHTPIDTKGLTLQDLKLLKEKTYQVIDAQLKHSFADKN